MKTHKKTIAYGILLLYSLLIAVVYISLHTVNVSAQTAEDICPNPGTSSHASCVQELNAAFDQCDSLGPGSSTWANCRQEAVNQFLTPSDVVGDGDIGQIENEGGDPLNQADCNPEGGGELNSENCGIIDIAVTIINFLSAVAGIAIIGSIMFAGYQYMTARDNPQTVQAARIRIVWALVALAIFIFMYALLNFLVPGGVLPQ